MPASTTSDPRTILESNLTALGPSARSALNRVNDRERAWSVTLSTDASGTVTTPDDRSVRLHSARHPLEEAEALIDPFLRNRPPLLIVLGLGFGYVLEALEKRSPETKVLAIEPAPAVTRAMLERRDWRGWLQSGRLTVIAGPDYTGAADAWKLIDVCAEAPPVIVVPSFERLCPDEVARARELAGRIVAGAQANEEARRRFAGRYLLNTLANLSTICTEADASSLFDQFTTLPAVIVAAGPSLDAKLDAVRALSERALIVAVDTAVRPLLAAGIRPHVAVAVDPTDANARHLADLPDAREIWLVGEGSINPVVFPQFAGRTFTFKVSGHEPWPFLAAHGVQRGTVQAWGSVLTTAYDLAVRAGCNPIVFAGADLAYTDGVQYCRNTVYEPHWQHLKTDAERAAALVPWLAQRPTITVPDIHARPVITTPAFVQFRDWIVARAHESGRPTLNGTGGGILVGSSIKPVDLSRWVEQSPSAVGVDIRSRLAAAWDKGVSDRAAEHHQLLDAIENCKAESIPIDKWIEFTRHTVSAGEIRRCLSDALLT